MQTTQGAAIESLRAVQSFLVAHGERLGGVTETGASKRLTRVIADIDADAATQSGGALGARGLTQTARKLRRVLIREHMAAISRIARADLPRTPELSVFRMPRGKPTPERLAAVAAGIAAAAEGHADVFIAAGLPPDFAARLTRAAEDLVAAVNDRTQTRGGAHGATAGLRMKISEGRRVVSILDVFVRTALGNDGASLAEWDAVKRVRKQRGHVVRQTDANEREVQTSEGRGVVAAPLPQRTVFGVVRLLAQATASARIRPKALLLSPVPRQAGNLDSP